MSGPDHEHEPDADARGRRDPHDDAQDGASLRTGPMDDERCLFVLALLRDGRPVEPARAAEARAWAAAHPECGAALAEMQEHAALLASTPPRRASAGFAARVLAELAPPARVRSSSGRGDILPFVRRLAVAAGLALAATLCFDLARPGTLSADAALQRHRHAVDHFKPDAFGRQDIQAGLRARMDDREFGLRARSADREFGAR